MLQVEVWWPSLRVLAVAALCFASSIVEGLTPPPAGRVAGRLLGGAASPTLTSLCPGTHLRAASGLGPSSEPPQSPQSLLIVGAGVLGQRVAAQYHAAGLGPVTCETLSETRHGEVLAALPFLRPWGQVEADQRGTLRTKAQGLASRSNFVEATAQTFDNVVFCAPPSGSADYPAEVAAACVLATRKAVFTSSCAVYREDAPVDLAVPTTEASPTKDPAGDPRVSRLIGAERAAHSCGVGVVVRLAGLYHASRGAHSHYLAQRSVASDPSKLVNLIHYDDAASLVVAALRYGTPGAVYVGCDGAPLSRQAIATAAAAGLGGPGCAFTGAAGSEPPGKALSNAWTRAALGWQPRFPSFSQFMARDR